MRTKIRTTTRQSMDPYEDRVRAVELDIKLGKCVGLTIRQLSCPTKNSLKGWDNGYQQKLDLPAGYAGRGPQFSQEQNAAAIEHYLTHDRCIAATMAAQSPFIMVSSG